MPDHGKDLGADLYKLLVVAKECLPAVAGVYQTAAKDIDAAGGQAANAMRRPDFFGGSLGGVHDSWMGLRSTLEKYLKDTESSLEDTGHVLAQAVSSYAAGDGEAAAELNRLRQEIGEPHV